MALHNVSKRNNVVCKNRFKNLVLLKRNTVFGYKIIYLQKNITKYIQIYIRTHNFLRI